MRGITPDLIEAQLREAEEHIARARARQLALLKMADALQLPIADGARSLHEWLAGRIDVSRKTASRLVRTAARLDEVPELAKSLSAGDLSFDRVEAMARIPREHHDSSLRGIDIQGLHRLAARLRHITSSDDHRSHAAQTLTIQPNLDESRWDIWGELDAYSGSVVTKVLTEEADRLPALPDGERMGLGYRRAVALTKICEGAAGPTSSTPLITVFVDDRGAEMENGPAVGQGILDKVACSGALEIIKTADGQPLGVGRTKRIIPARLRRFILHRDGGCTADGCVSRYRLQVHHKKPWSEGGSTDPENLTTLCWFHHHVVVHGFGYRIDDRHGPGRLRFVKRGHDPPGGGGGKGSGTK